MEQDFYSLLGVDRTATVDQIRSAYRRAAMKAHPDRNPGDKDAEARFKRISEAYDVLSNEKKRRLYDQFGREGLRGTPMRDYGKATFEEILGAFGEVFSDPSFFGDFFGARRKAGPKRASPTDCSVCGGTGMVARASGFFTVQRTCTECGGNGKAAKK